MRDRVEDHKIKLDCHIHWTMALVGGILGAYSLLNRNDTFGSSVTANFIYFFFKLLGHNWHDFVLRLIAVLTYTAGLAVSVFVPKITKADIRYVAIGIDAAAVIIIANLPEDMNFLVALYPILFATAFQWCVYSGAKGYNCSSIFSTNNLKQTTLGFCNYLLNRDEKQLDKAKFFGTTIVFYHIGVCVCWISCKYMGLRGAYVALLPLLIAAVKVRRKIGME